MPNRCSQKLLYFILTYLFFALLSCNCLFSSTDLATKQQILPTGFGYFENLYFCVPHRTFFSVGENIDFKKAINTFAKRGYSWKNRHFIAKSSQEESLIIVPGTTVVVFERYPGHFAHLFHSLEHFIGLWNFGGERLREEVKLFLFASDGKKVPSNWKGQKNDTTYHLIRALFPHAEIKIWPDFINEANRKVLLFEKVLTSDRYMELFKKEPYPTERMLGGFFQSLTKDSLDHLASVVHEYVQVDKLKSDKVIVTYITRTPPRCLLSEIENELLHRIKMLPQIDLNIVDFSNLSFTEQINVAANTDVLLSVHGNGLTHTLFLPNGATLIELFPKNIFRVEYRIIAKARGLNYFGMIQDKGWIDDATVNRLGSFGKNHDIPITKLDVEAIISVLQNCKKASL